MSVTVSGIRVEDLPNLGVVTDASEFVGDNAGTGVFSAPALRNYVAQTIATTPQKFGAIGDGVNDDTNALQAAINTGGRIYLPAGTYRITRGLVATRQFVLFGSGWSSTILADPAIGPSVDAFTLRPPSAGVMWGTEISDLQIVCSAGQHALELDLSAVGASLAMCAFANLALYGGTGRGIHLDNSNHDGFFISGIRGCYISGGVQLMNAGDSLDISNNTIFGSNPAIDISSIPGSASVVIEGNNLTSSGGALVLASMTQAKIVFNQCEQAAGYTGVAAAQIDLVDCTNCLIADNNLNAFSAVQSNIVLNGTSSGNTITRNVMSVRVSTPGWHVSAGPSAPANWICADNQYGDAVSGPLQFPSLNLSAPQFGAFVGVSLQNGWVAGVDSAVRQGLFYMRDISGRVTVSGNIRSGTNTAGIVFANLPGGYRPQVMTRALAMSYNAGTTSWNAVVVRAWTNGDIGIDTVAFPTNTDVQIDISFMAL